MGSLGHVLWRAQVLPQRHPQLARPFCTCRLTAGQAAAPRGDRLCLRQFLLFRGVWSRRWEMSDRLLLVAWVMSDNPTAGERKCLRGHKVRDECPTMKQMGNRASKEVTGDESKCALKMRLAGNHSDLQFGSGSALPYLVSGSVVWDRVLMCVRQLVSYIRVSI